MQIEIPCEVIGRLSQVNHVLPQNENRKWLSSIFVERTSSGHVFVGATNAQFAAIEMIGIQRGEVGFVVLKRDDVWLDAARNSDPDVKCNVNEWSEMNFCTLTAPNGYSTTGDAAIRDPEAIATLKKWRDWLPEALPSETGRSMFIDIDGLQSLVNSSPSGCVVFPQIIDSSKPIIVRDVYSPDWLGVFYAQPANGLFLKGAQLPDWVKKQCA